MIKRFVREYAKDKIRSYERVIAECPRLLDDCTRAISRINQAVEAYERYEIIADDAIRMILEA